MTCCSDGSLSGAACSALTLEFLASRVSVTAWPSVRPGFAPSDEKGSFPSSEAREGILLTLAWLARFSRADEFSMLLMMLYCWGSAVSVAESVGCGRLKGGRGKSLDWY